MLKIPCKWCFLWLWQILLSCIFIIFYIMFLRFFFDPSVIINMLLNLQIVWDFPGVFCCWFLFQILLWSKNMLCMIFILSNLLRCVSWSRMWSILGNVPCKYEENVYTTDFWMKHSINFKCIKVIYTAIQVDYILIDFSISIYLLDLPITDRGIDASSCNIGFVYFSFHFNQFLPHLFWYC